MGWVSGAVETDCEKLSEECAEASESRRRGVVASVQDTIIHIEVTSEERSRIETDRYHVLYLRPRVRHSKPSDPHPLVHAKMGE